MARLATDVVEMVRRYVSPVGQNLVTLSATDCLVPTLQREPGLPMAREAEIGGHEPFHGVTLLATVLMGGADELALVNISVAIQTELILDAVLRGFAGRTMALFARYGSVLSQ